MFTSLFGRTETLRIPGPLVPDPTYPPRVTIRCGYDSATVTWDPGRMHPAMPAWSALGFRLQAAGLLAAVDDWIEHHGRHADPRLERDGALRSGRVLHVPLADADALAGLVVGYLNQAVAAPLTLAEFAQITGKDSGAVRATTDTPGALSEADVAVLRDMAEHCATQENRWSRFLTHEQAGRERRHAYGPEKTRGFVETWQRRRTLLEKLLA